MLQIKPFHLFNHRDQNFLINVESMEVCKIDEDLAVNLVYVKNNPGDAVGRNIETKLEKLSLIDIDEKPISKVIIDEKSTDTTIIAVTLFLTQICNLDCVYCYGDSGKYGQSGIMKKDTAIKTIDWLIDQSGNEEHIYITLFGGEPFLNFKLMKEVVEYANSAVAIHNKQVKFHTATNGTLFTDEVIAFIKKNKIHVSVSFDGTEELQNAQRPFPNGEGSYNTILPGLKKLLKATSDTFGHAVLMDDTNPEVVQEALHEIGFSEISISMASSSLFNKVSTENNGQRETTHILEQLELEAEKWINFAQEKDEKSLKQILLRSQLYNPLMSIIFKNKRMDTCGAGRKNVAVSINGDIYLCHRFVGMEDYKLGNVNDDNIKRDSYLSSPINCNEKCRMCFAKYYCGGGCKHDNLGACGSVFNSPEDMCLLRCREFELAAYVYSSLSQNEHEYLRNIKVFPTIPCPIDF